MKENLIILLGWICGICSVLLTAELCVSIVKYFITRKTLKLKQLGSCSQREQ